MRNRRPASPPSCVCCFAGGALGVLPGALRSPTALCARSPGLSRCLQPCPPARLRCLDVVPELVGCIAVCPQRVTAPGLCNSQVKSIHPHRVCPQRVTAPGLCDSQVKSNRFADGLWVCSQAPSARLPPSAPDPLAGAGAYIPARLRWLNVAPELVGGTVVSPARHRAWSL
jgi:hypothetical protein